MAVQDQLDARQSMLNGGSRTSVNVGRSSENRDERQVCGALENTVLPVSRSVCEIVGVDEEAGQSLFKVPQKRKKKDKYHEIKSPLKNDPQLSEDHETESDSDSD